MVRVLGENLNQGIQFHENAAQTDCRIRGDLKEAVCYCRGVRIPSSHLCYEPDDFFMNSSLPLAFRLLPYFFLLPTMTILVFLGQSSTAEDLPAWKKGLSTWNGTNYEAPTSSNSHDGFTLPIEAPKPRPYTIPSDPRNTSDTAGKLGRTIGDGNSDDGGYAPEDIQTLPKLDALAWPDEAARIRNSTSASNTGITNDQPTKWPTPDAISANRHQASAASPTDSTDETPFSALPNHILETLADKNPNLSADSSPMPHPSATELPVAQQQESSGSVSEEINSHLIIKHDKNANDPDDTREEKNNSGNSSATSAAAPLQADVTRWYEYPRKWMEGWDSHAQFGLDGSDGNANTLAMQAGLELKRKTERYTFGMDINYRQASSRSKTTEQNGRFNLNFDRLLGDTSWSAFAKHGMEWDQFKPFDLRLNLNGGVGYYLLRSDTATLATRFGGGASREIGAPIDSWIPEAVFGLEAEKQLTPRQKLKGKIDYFPAWENFGDYRIVSDASWEILLDGSENLSLKLAATDRYDSTPQGARPNDLYYSLLLLYKF